MKKLMLAVFISAFCVAVSNAQVKVGAKLGLNVSSLNGDLPSAIDPKVGLHVGAMAEIPFSDKIAFQPELLFSMQGASYSYAVFGGEIDSKRNLNYLNLPLMGKYKIVDELTAEFGPQIGFLLSAKEKGKNDNGDSVKIDSKDNYKGFDVGLNFGAGYKLDNGINFAIRYNLGLVNINDIENSNIVFRNGVLQLSAGYFFM